MRLRLVLISICRYIYIYIEYSHIYIIIGRIAIALIGTYIYINILDYIKILSMRHSHSPL